MAMTPNVDEPKVGDKVDHGHVGAEAASKVKTMKSSVHHCPFVTRPQRGALLKLHGRASSVARANRAPPGPRENALAKHHARLAKNTLSDECANPHPPCVPGCFRRLLYLPFSFLSVCPCIPTYILHNSPLYHAKSSRYLIMLDARM